MAPSREVSSAISFSSSDSPSSSAATEQLDRWSSLLSLGLVAVATLLFLVPAIPGWTGDPERHSLAVVSLPVSIVLLVLYVIVITFVLRRHHALHVSDEPASMAAWSLTRSLVVLGMATVVTALVAEILVGSIETFADRARAFGLLRRGSHRRHRGQRGRARRGCRRRGPRQDQARGRDRAVLERSGGRLPHPGSPDPLVGRSPRHFRSRSARSRSRRSVVPPLFVALVLWGGRSSRRRGLALIGAYAGVAAAFFAAGDR